jgi:RNA-binding protein YhbY
MYNATSVDPEIGIRRIATSKDKDKLQKIGLYLNMYKEKWKKAVIKMRRNKL